MIDSARNWRQLEERTRTANEENFLRGIERSHAEASRWRVFDRADRVVRMSSFEFQGLLRKVKIFRWLDRLEFESVLDVGAGLDAYPGLIRARYGVPTYTADLVHRLNWPGIVEQPEGSPRAKVLDHSVSLSLTRLPFADDSFDVVLATEVLEHLVRPIEAIAEMRRVARKYVVLSSLELLSVGRWQRFLARMRVDPRQPHVERNFLLMPEIEAIFGPGLTHENLFFVPDLPCPKLGPATPDDMAAYDRLCDPGRLAAALCSAGAVRDHRPGAMGVILIHTAPGAAVRPAAADDLPLTEWLLRNCAAAEDAGFRLLGQVMEQGWASVLPALDRPVSPALLAHLVCPNCRGRLESSPGGVRCLGGCREEFAAEYGVPMLYPTRWPDDASLEAETRALLCGGDDARWRTVCAVMRSLRRHECDPGAWRRLWWWGESRIGARPQSREPWRE